MISLLRKITFILLIGPGFCQYLYGQSDSSIPLPTKEKYNAFYIIDRVYSDPRNPDKRTVVGAANFFRIEGGMLSIAAGMPQMTFLFTGKIDSLENVVVDQVPVLRVYATNNYDNVTVYPYVFEISRQDNDGSVLIYASRLRTTAGRYYFEAHVASSTEMEQVRENASKKTGK